MTSSVGITIMLQVRHINTREIKGIVEKNLTELCARLCCDRLDIVAICNQVQKYARNLRRLMRILLIAVITTWLTACIMTAAGRNDFSKMGNDYFSILIKNAGSEKVGPIGFFGINQIQIKQRVSEFFIGKKEADVLMFFEREGGQCAPLEPIDGRLLLTCHVSRWWNLKKIEFPFFETEDPSWPEPGARLVFRFYIVPIKEISKLEVEIIDVTINKPIY
ncbi:hypothetical protein CCP3SC15_590005 [Gammaproteobacteria bacterium]